ncbi:MAG TPA: S1 RNA-binding domain-containing protein [Candidatus Paceibacterota bacterium]|nr:S1 RNA-binding domain-containing protein [Candidatus Paceibacterota bacterium]
MKTQENKNYPQQLFKQFVKAKPDLFSILKTGDLVQGRVIDKGANTIVVDLGRHGIGVVYREEIQNAREIVRTLKIGDEVHAKVIEIDNDDGVVELSLTEAGKQRAWAEVQELQEKDEPLKLKILGSNRGGLVSEIAGLAAFLPVSQLSTEHYPMKTSDENAAPEALEKLIGEELTVKIIDANPRSNKLIVSERAANEVSAKELVKKYEVGQVIEGIVSGVADFGVFVRFTENPAIEGLIHVSELSWRVVENPKEIVSVDDVVKVKITDIKDGRVSLSLKALQPNPWEGAAERYRKGEGVRGKIYAFHPFGAIVNLEDGLQGQIHVSEFGGAAEMKEKLAIGKEYDFTIEDVKPEEKRIALRLGK